MQAFLASITFWHWWILGAIFVVLEIVAPGVFLLWLGVAATIVGLVVLAAPALGGELQAILFAVLAVGNVYLAWRFLGRNRETTDHPDLNRRGRELIGRSFTLTEPIANGRGRLKVGDSLWAVAGPDLAAGTAVKVVELDGTVLKVERA